MLTEPHSYWTLSLESPHSIQISTITCHEWFETSFHRVLGPQFLCSLTCERREFLWACAGLFIQWSACDGCSFTGSMVLTFFLPLLWIFHLCHFFLEGKIKVLFYPVFSSRQLQHSMECSLLCTWAYSASKGKENSNQRRQNVIQENCRAWVKWRGACRGEARRPFKKY